MKIIKLAFLFTIVSISAQTDVKIYDIINDVSADRIKADIKTLTEFGTRNTFSDTTSTTHGIGAARRWIKSEFETISKSCDNCIDVFYQKDFVTKKGNRRVPHDAWIVNVVAIQKGTKYPNRYVIMSGDIDSRASDTMDFKTDAPGANDNASGMAGTMEAARVLSNYKFENSIIY
ncbi:MAG: M28 family peptidase, partial [Polaribacter sp.]|nr:M28 family peptidase [Polaribacter sp.]